MLSDQEFDVFDKYLSTLSPIPASTEFDREVDRIDDHIDGDTDDEATSVDSDLTADESQINFLIENRDSWLVNRVSSSIRKGVELRLIVDSVMIVSISQSQTALALFADKKGFS